MQARGREPGSRGGGGQPASAGSEAPGQGLPQGQRDSLAPGRVRCPHAGKGALTQPGQAHRAAVPGSLPVPWERRWVPGAGCSVPARQERWDTVPRSTADRPGQPAIHSPLLLLPPPPAPGQAPAPSSPKPWPGAQLGPGGQSYCKRPGRTEAWTLPAGHSCRHLPLPGQGRVPRPPPSQQATPMAEGGGGEKTQALPRAGLRPQPESRPSVPSPDTLPITRLPVGPSPALAPSPQREAPSSLASSEGGGAFSQRHWMGWGGGGVLFSVDQPSPPNVERFVYPPPASLSSAWSYL